MISKPRPLRVVVISQDVSLLHEISWILDAVGYKVHTSKDFAQHALWRLYSCADFVIVDGREITDPSAATFGHDSDNPHFRIFLYDPTKDCDFTAWYAAGAHDALRTPVSRGELLARLRNGARYLEFERRLNVQSSRCELPGMYSHGGFLRKLRNIAAGDGLGSSQYVLLVTSIDWYAGVRRKNGETASRSLSNSVARAIRRAVGASAVSAYFGDGRFATLLMGQSIDAAKCIAESLAKDFGCRESHHESTPRPTLTSAVMPWLAGSNAERLLNDALETLEVAEHSGGNCVVSHDEFNEEFAAWKEELSTGNPFVNVVAQDVMEPFPAVLHRDIEPSEWAAAIRRSGIPVRPCFNSDGQLLGVAAAENVAETQIDEANGPADELLTEPETIPHDATFLEIYEAFSSRGCDTLVVTAGEHPLGYLTCDGFLSMIDPIHAESFAHTDKSPDELAFLIVPSKVGEAAAEAVGA